MVFMMVSMVFTCCVIHLLFQAAQGTEWLNTAVFKIELTFGDVTPCYPGSGA